MYPNTVTLTDAAGLGIVRRRPRRRRAAATIGKRKSKPCPLTGSRSYRTRGQAKEALESCRWQREWDLAAFGSSPRRESRIVPCDCGAFHLRTAEPTREEV